MKMDEDEVLLLTYFHCKMFLSFVLVSQMAGRRLPRSQAFSFSLVPKIQYKLHDMLQLRLQCSSTQPKRDYHIARICLQREPSCIKKNTEFSTQVLLPALLYFNLYSERDFRLVTFSYSSSQWSIYDASFCFFWYVTPILFNSSLAGVSAVMSEFKKWRREIK